MKPKRASHTKSGNHLSAGMFPTKNMLTIIAIAPRTQAPKNPIKYLVRSFTEMLQEG